MRADDDDVRDPRRILSARLSSDPEPPPGVDPETYRRDTAARMVEAAAPIS